MRNMAYQFVRTVRTKLSLRICLLQMSYGVVTLKEQWGRVIYPLGKFMSSKNVFNLPIHDSKLLTKSISENPL